MQRHLFLTGPTGCGKRELLLRELGNSLAGAGGFMTTALHGPYGDFSGFALSPAAAAAGVVGFAAECFLDCSHFPPRCDNEVFRRTGVRLLEEAAWYPFAVLDEFGAQELLIPQFREALFSLLRADLPLIGAVRSYEEADAMRQALGLGLKWRGYRKALDELLAGDADCRVLDLPADPAAAEAAVRTWVKEYSP